MGNYRVIGSCGGGELSELYSAQDLAVGRKVVIRLMRNPIGTSAEPKERFEASAERLESLKHENIAKCKGHGLLDDGRPYLVFEWLEGDKLNEAELTTRALASLGAEFGENFSDLVASAGQIAVVGGPHKVLGFDWAPNIASSDVARNKLFERNDELPEPTAEGSYKEIAGRLKDEFSSDKIATKLEAGTLISDTYRIVKLIGQGGMGCVYEAEHTRLPQHVAIKIVGGNYSEDSIVRFRREAEISSSLGHPNIVKVFDFNTLPDGTPYMVMEYLEGQELSKALAEGAFTIERAASIVRSIGSALSAVHDIGVVHRDLKPQNVFLRNLKAAGGTKEHAMVLDFGVSKQENVDSALTVANAVVGTPRYMSPEQAKGQNEDVSALSDQFALGVLAYEMLAGRPAFTRGDISEVIYRVCHVEPPRLVSLNPSIPLSLSMAVERAMSKASCDRFPSVAAFVAAFCGEAAIEPTVEQAVFVAVANDIDDSDNTAATVVNTAGQSAIAAARAGAKPSDEVDREPSSAQSAPPVPAQSAPPVPAPAPPVPAPPAAPAPQKGMRWLAGASVVAALLLVIGTVLYLTKTSEPVSSASKVSTITTDARSVRVSLMDASVPPISTDASEVEIADAAVVAVDAAKFVKPDKFRTPPSSKDGSNPQYQEAKALLAKGRYRDARRFVSRDSELAKSSRGRALIVKTYCGEGNFGAAKDWLARVPRSSRKAVQKFCKSKHGIDLN